MIDTDALIRAEFAAARKAASNIFEGQEIFEFGVYSPETGSPRKALPPEAREGWYGILIADDLDYAAHVKYDGGNEFRFTEVPLGKRLTGILVTSNGRFIWERRFKTPVYSAGGSVTVNMEALTDYFLC